MYYSEIIYRVNDQGMIVEEIDKLDNDESQTLNPNYTHEYEAFDNMIEGNQAVNS